MRIGGTARATGLALSLTFSVSRLVFAQGPGYPTFDYAAFVQGKLQNGKLDHQAAELGRIYAKQIEELAALIGSRGMGDLLNGSVERAARRAVPPTLEALLQSAAEGRLPSSYDELAGILTRIQRELELASSAQVYGPDAQTPVARAYERTQRTTLANLAVSDQAYQRAAQRVESYEALIQAINGTADVKASSDLVARLLAENGLSVNELIRLQALELSATSAERAAMLATRANLAEISKFDPEAYERLVQHDVVATWDEKE
jgi:hypothetical protein